MSGSNSQNHHTSNGNSRQGEVSDTNTDYLKLENDYIKYHIKPLRTIFYKVDDLMHTSTFIREKDKLTYLFMIYIFLGYYILLFHNLGWFIIYHCVKITLLLLIRFFDYHRKGIQYFFTDFCYTGNVLVIFFLLANSHDTEFFKAIFGYCIGPIHFAVLVYRMTFVPHHLDKMTSLLIHIDPALIVYIVRFYNMQGHTFSSQLLDQQLLNDGLISVFISFAKNYYFYYFIWLAIYLSIIFLFRQKVIEEREYLTLYRYSIESHKATQAWVNMFGPKYTKIMYAWTHWAWMTVMMLVAFVCYNSFIISTVAIFLNITASFYNGGNFYIEYISKKYIQNLQELEKLKKLKKQMRENAKQAQQQKTD